MAVKGLTTSTPKKSQQHEKQFIQLQEKDTGIRFFFLNPCENIGWPYLGKATAAARAALPIPIGVCSVFVCPDSVWLALLGILNLPTDVEACDCTRGLYGKRLH